MVGVSRTYRQRILRRVRSQLDCCIDRFRLVNDDDLGQTYVAKAVRGPGYVIVEIGVEDGEFVIETFSGLTVRYDVLTRHIADTFKKGGVLK